MKPSDTFVLEVNGLRDRVKAGRFSADGVLDRAILAQPEVDRLPMVDVVRVWQGHRNLVYLLDWRRATWPTLADAQAYAAYLSAKADTNPERAEDARLFAAFVEALPEAWDWACEDGEV